MFYAQRAKANGESPSSLRPLRQPAEVRPNKPAVGLHMLICRQTAGSVNRLLMTDPCMSAFQAYCYAELAVSFPAVPKSIASI